MKHDWYCERCGDWAPFSPSGGVVQACYQCGTPRSPAGVDRDHAQEFAAKKLGCGIRCMMVSGQCAECPRREPETIDVPCVIVEPKQLPPAT